MNLLEGKKFILVGIIVALLAAIPLTVYFMQQTQETRSRAQKATTLYFATSGQTAAATTIQKNLGDVVPIDIIMDPGTNQVSFVKMSISYDPTKLSTESGGIKQNDLTFPSILEGPTYTDGNISITLSIGADPTKVVQAPSKIATITLKAKETTGTTPTQIKFLDTQTQVLSIASSDQPSENVLASTKPISITIQTATGTTPTVTPVSSASVTPGHTTTPAPTTSPQPTTTQTNAAPSCTSLTLDKTPSGTAPFALTFTANGKDSNGTISKVTFNFGDGPVQDVTSSGGIGTNTVSVPLSHTYTTAGTYQASAILTDNQGSVSSNTCTQTITVTAAAPTVPLASSTTPPVATPTIAPPGASDAILKVGVLGALLSIIGALTFFAL